MRVYYHVRECRCRFGGIDWLCMVYTARRG